MNNSPRLHHYCQEITKGHLQDIVEMYKLLGFDVVYRPDGSNDWIMVGQKQLRFAIQIVEASNDPISDINAKRQTHIAFISNQPDQVIETVEGWANKKKLNFRKGGWSDAELFFDLPDIFINFVVEVMHTSIEKG